MISFDHTTASILVSYSKEDTDILRNSNIHGKLLIPYQ